MGFLIRLLRQPKFPTVHSKFLLILENVLRDKKMTQKASFLGVTANLQHIFVFKSRVNKLDNKLRQWVEATIYRGVSVL